MRLSGVYQVVIECGSRVPPCASRYRPTPLRIEVTLEYPEVNIGPRAPGKHRPSPVCLDLCAWTGVLRAHMDTISTRLGSYMHTTRIPYAHNSDLPGISRSWMYSNVAAGSDKAAANSSSRIFSPNLGTEGRHKLLNTSRCCVTSPACDTCYR